MRLLAPLVALGMVLLGAPVAASAASECSGVTVVVDFGSLGGGVRTGCAGGDPGSGLAALGGAGFAFDLASRQPGFVCRINGAPASDPCVNAAPNTAYWSYWHGTPGGSWSYSSAGASGYDPAPGSVEGWAFGAGGQPGIAPPAPAPQPQPQPQPQPPVQPAPNQPAPGRPAPSQPASGQTGQPAPSGTASEQPAPSQTGSSASATGSSATSPPASPSESAPASTSVVPTAGSREDRGVPVGLIVGLAVMVALGAAGWWIARRRAESSGGAGS
ncbi:hypothetical protein [Saccharothrix variisporea]|uniref:MYXO-CTERM domain-containing protein n=1 Tax=Saccharothrix variisporea TaxID=543527 RepID=A0A495X7H5_9PSEU|nr:hypothetical protein [Saccharothrix variisporea]RKT67468.1 hypothetical protein DFJ66_0643 [Saccharothrix variisporea]